MPVRTINDAAFSFASESGVIIHVRRGDQVDIPEGDDLKRGEACGSFTQDNAEPKAPEGTEMPEIEPNWEAEDFKRYVDEGTVEEIKAKFAGVPDEAKEATAQRLLAAEESRGEKVRKGLTDFLKSHAGAETVNSGFVSVEEPVVLDDINPVVEPVVIPADEAKKPGPKKVQ